MEREALRKSLARMRNSKLTAAFHTWYETAFNMKMQQLALRQVTMT